MGDRPERAALEIPLGIRIRSMKGPRVAGEDAHHFSGEVASSIAFHPSSA